MTAVQNHAGLWISNGRLSRQYTCVEANFEPVISGLSAA